MPGVGQEHEREESSYLVVVWQPLMRGDLDGLGNGRAAGATRTCGHSL
jgi:hypothetical protein